MLMEKKQFYLLFNAIFNNRKISHYQHIQVKKFIRYLRMNLNNYKNVLIFKKKTILNKYLRVIIYKSTYYKYFIPKQFIEKLKIN